MHLFVETRTPEILIGTRAIYQTTGYTYRYTILFPLAMFYALRVHFHAMYYTRPNRAMNRIADAIRAVTEY